MATVYSVQRTNSRANPVVKNKPNETSAQKVDIMATLALGSGTEIDADADGQPLTVTMGGAAGTGTIEVTVKYVLD